jgi:DNA-directed RNA polymerase specialized sigma24 family protein
MPAQTEIQRPKEARPQVRELAADLYRENAGFLLAVAINNSHSRRDAEEAIQEALISFIRSYEVGGAAPPLRWLLLTLKRQCWRQGEKAHLDRYLGQEVERGDDHRGTLIESLSSPGTDFETRIADLDEARCRLARLKANERTGLGLLAAGFSYKEIASRRGWTYTKVNRCIREGRAALAAA